MRILQLVQKPQRRGAEVFALGLANELRDRGHCVQCVYLYRYLSDSRLPAQEDEVELAGVEDRLLERLPGFHPRLLWRLRQTIRRFSPDVVQVNGSRTVKYGALARRFETGLTWVLVYRNIGHPADWLRGRPRQWFYRRLVGPWIDGVVGVSQRTLKAVELFYGLTVPTVQIPRGVECGTVAPARSRAQIRQELGTAEPSPVLLFVGSLTPEKRLDRLLRIAARVQVRLPDLEVWIVGDGPQRQELTKNAKEQGVAVRFLGLRTAVGDFLNAADLLLLTSDTEGIPGVVLEAACCSLPTVATRVGGTDECIVNGESGVLVEREDEEGFSTCVAQLLRDHQRRQAMGRRALAEVQNRFSMATVATRYEEFYRYLVEERRSAPTRRGLAWTARG